MSGHSALGFAKHSALGIWQQLWRGQASGQAYHADSRRNCLLIVKPMGAGNPPVAGTDVREQGTPLVVARDRGPLARIRAPRRGSPGRGRVARTPCLVPKRAPGLRYANARRVHGRTPGDGRCRRNSHRTGRPCGGPYRSPPKSSRILRTARDSTAPGPDNQPGDGARPRESPCQLALALVTIPPQSD